LTRDQPSARRHRAQLRVEQHQRPHRRGSGPQSHLSSLITGRRSTPTARRPSSRCCVSQGNEPGSLSDISCSNAPMYSGFNVPKFQSSKTTPRQPTKKMASHPFSRQPPADINRPAATHC
jgi:hypothetical protein